MCNAHSQMLYAMRMRLKTLILLTLISFVARSQNYIQTFDGLDRWAGQTKYDYELLSRFDKYCRENNLLIGSLSMIDMRKENSWDYTLAVDINNDSLQDVVYSGPSGGEPNIVCLFVQTDYGFEPVFAVQQGISKVIWKGGLLDKVYTSDWGCCAEISLINSVYDVSYNNNNFPVFTKVFQTIEVNDVLIKPKNYFPIPIEFIVENQVYKLRLEPKIDDTKEFPWVEIVGNTIATLNKGTTGIAYASETDDTGRIWWYVAIEVNKNVQNSILRSYDYEQTKIIGWLSSRYVKVAE